MVPEKPTLGVGVYFLHGREFDRALERTDVPCDGHGDVRQSDTGAQLRTYDPERRIPRNETGIQDSIAGLCGSLPAASSARHCSAISGSSVLTIRKLLVPDPSSLPSNHEPMASHSPSGRS